MKRTMRLIFALGGLLWAIQSGGAQGNPALEIAGLKEQIKQLQLILRDPATTAEVREVSSRHLGQRLATYRTLLRQEIAGLRSYAEKATFLNSDERKELSERIRQLEAESGATNGAATAGTTVGVIPKDGTSPTVPSAGSVQPNSNAATDTSANTEKGTLHLESSGLPLRAILGFEQVGNAAAASSQRAFLDLYLNSPLPGAGEGRMRLWGNIRFSSLPKQSFSAATDATGNLLPIKPFDSATVGRIKDLTRTVEFMIGPEIKLRESRSVSLSFIAAGGAITPGTPQDGASFYRIPADVETLYPQAKSLHPYKNQVVAFVPPDRDRFLRQYFAGFRLKLLTAGTSGASGGVFDVTFGQSEAMTSGRLRGGILRLEGFYPLPIPNNQFLYLFGTAMMKLSRSNISDPIILQPADPVPLPSKDVPIITTHTNRDFYRFGVGIDVLKLLSDTKNEKH